MNQTTTKKLSSNQIGLVGWCASVREMDLEFFLESWNMMMEKEWKKIKLGKKFTFNKQEEWNQACIFFFRRVLFHYYYYSC